MKTNYPAVVVSAIAYWLLGAIWFGVMSGFLRCFERRAITQSFDQHLERR